MDLVLYKDLVAADMTVLLNLLQKHVFNFKSTSGYAFI